MPLLYTSYKLSQCKRKANSVVTVYRRPDPIPRQAAARPARLRSLAIREDSTSLTQLVARRIFCAIDDGTFPEGTILPNEQVLAVELGVSRTALREAITALGAKGLIEARRRRGTQVLKRIHWNMLDLDIIRWSRHGQHDGISTELWQAMRAILPDLAAAASRRRSVGALAALGHAIASAEDGAGYRARIDFLLELASLGRNRFLLSAVSTSLQSLARDHASFLQTAMAGITADFASRLVDAIAAGHDARSADLVTKGLAEPAPAERQDYIRAL